MSDDYYGFAEQPFTLTPDPRFFFRSGSHEKAIEELQRGIERREGFMLLTGDIGTGKTTLSRTLLEQLGRKTFTALVLNPFVTEEELLRVILQDFDIVSCEEVRRGALVGSTKQDLVDVLNQFLLSLAEVKASAVLVIDEAQNLPPATLEQIRVLTNLETDRQKLLQIVIVGQLNLVSILGAAEMRQLNQRISRRCMLEPLDRDGTEGYISHRLRLARGDVTVEFTSRALDTVQRRSGGVPRLINMLCDRTLEIGQTARATKITRAIVRQAAQQLALETPRRRRSDRRLARLKRLAVRLGTAAAVTAAILVGAYQVTRYYDVPLWPNGPTRLTAGAPAMPAATPRPAPPAAASQPGATATYSLLVGVFPSREAAVAAGERLQRLGYAVQDIVQPEGREEYRVRIGRYDDIALARQHAEQLQRDPEFRDATIVTER